MPPGALWRPGRFRFAGPAPTPGQPLFGEGQVLAGAFASEHLPELVVEESGVLLESLEHASAVGPGEQASNEALVVVGVRRWRDKSRSNQLADQSARCPVQVTTVQQGIGELG